MTLTTYDSRKSTLPDASAWRVDHRGLLAGGCAVVLADSGVEGRLRPRRPAVGLHGHADLAAHAHAPGPRRRPAGLRGPPADDAHGPAAHLPAHRADGRRPPLA